MQHTLSCLVLVSSGLLAQSVVVPNTSATTVSGTQLNSIIRNQGNPRTYQYGINASELANVPLGSVITGVSLRFSQTTTNPVSWPPADITWNDYDIWAGPANPTASWGTDPMLNFSGTPQQVRSGPMTMDAGVFSNLSVAGVPNPFAEFYFNFQTPLLYLGGDLAMLFSHPGSNDPALALYPETVASDATTHGVGRVQSAYPASTAMSASTFYVMRVHYGYGAGCPSSTGDVPVLVQNENLTGGLGGNILLQAANTAPGSLVLLAVGAAPLQAPLGSGWDLLVTPDVVLFAGVSNANGRVSLSLPVAPGVVGSFFAQCAALDFALPLGFCVTNAVSPVAN